MGTLRVPISHGAFTGRKASGGTLLWSIRGKFTSRTAARVSVHIKALCDGRSGGVRVTLVP